MWRQLRARQTWRQAPLSFTFPALTQHLRVLWIQRSLFEVEFCYYKATRLVCYLSLSDSIVNIIWFQLRTSCGRANEAAATRRKSSWRSQTGDFFVSRFFYSECSCSHDYGLCITPIAQDWSQLHVCLDSKACASNVVAQQRIHILV